MTVTDSCQHSKQPLLDRWVKTFKNGPSKICGRHTQGVLHGFSIKNIFYDKMDLKVTSTTKLFFAIK